jgi:succinate-semialdehyde dehydrogenase/glutarate-semialdehyde dehydrogenase
MSVAAPQRAGAGAPERIDPFAPPQQCYVDGAWIGAPETEVRDPATGEVVGRVPRLEPSAVQAAIAAAARAGRAWGARPADERATVLHRWHALILGAAEDLAWLLTREQGKPLAEARAEIAYAASYVAWYAEEARRLYGEVVPAAQPDRRLLVLREPVGVVAAITPWNFPAAMVTRKVAPALAAGCTVVLKPAPQTPFTALALARLAAAAGVPGGAFNVVTGHDAAIGEAFSDDPRVRKIAFTGSTRVGKLLVAQSAGGLKRMSMELGGNAAFIVFEDADLNAAVAGAVACKFRNSGQTCVSANRFLVQRAVAPAFEMGLASAVGALRVGPGVDERVAQGPLIDEAAVRKVEAHIADALRKGARLVCGGARHALGGTFFQPTVLAGCTPDMAIAHEETFGPVAALFPFETEAEALALANDTPYGLAGYFYSRDLARVWRAAAALEVGMVGVNTGLISTAAAPFGGVKESGFGREGSRHGLEDYTTLKYVCLAGLTEPAP